MAAETILLAASVGVVGGSIEDMDNCRAIYDLSLATERIAAAAEAAHGLPFAFTLTARAENYLAGRADLEDTIHRLQAYQQAGADVLYAPGLKNLEDIASLVRSLDKPVNVVMGLQGASFSLAELSSAGVRRISVGSALSRTALGAFLRAAQEMLEHGTFTFAEDAVPFQKLQSMFDRS